MDILPNSNLLGLPTKVISNRFDRLEKIKNDYKLLKQYIYKEQDPYVDIIRGLIPMLKNMNDAKEIAKSVCNDITK